MDNSKLNAALDFVRSAQLGSPRAKGSADQLGRILFRSGTSSLVESEAAAPSASDASAKDSPAKPSDDLGGAAESPTAGMDLRDKVQQSFVVGGQIIAFDGTVTAERKAATITSTHFASLFAFHTVPENNTAAGMASWYAQYKLALNSIGWDVQQTLSQQYSATGTNVEVSKAIIDIITPILGGGAALTIVTNVLNVLKNMSKDSPVITIWDQQTRSNETAQFQVSLATTDPAKGFLLRGFMFSLFATKEVTQVLLFTFSDNDAKFRFESNDFTLDDESYKNIQQIIEQKADQYRNQVLEFASTPSGTSRG